MKPQVSTSQRQKATKSIKCYLLSAIFISPLEENWKIVFSALAARCLRAVDWERGGKIVWTVDSRVKKIKKS